MDLVDAHIAALKAAETPTLQPLIYNVGVGKGYSVREFVNACLKVSVDACLSVSHSCGFVYAVADKIPWTDPWCNASSARLVFHAVQNMDDNAKERSHTHISIAIYFPEEERGD